MEGNKKFPPLTVEVATRVRTPEEANEIAKRIVKHTAAFAKGKM